MWVKLRRCEPVSSDRFLVRSYLQFANESDGIRQPRRRVGSIDRHDAAFDGVVDEPSAVFDSEMLHHLILVEGHCSRRNAQRVCGENSGRPPEAVAADLSCS